MHYFIGLLFFLFAWGSLGIIQYYVCPEEVMPDKEKGAFMAVQLLLATVTTFWLFNLFNDLYDLEYRFGDEDWQRILFAVCLSFICFFVIGLLIEGFLILVEPTYRKWRFAKPE
jgi:hypothetical protein